MGGSDEVIVAVVALIVSVVALSATFMQVLQQYYASASGYSQCNDKVMGAWARTKSRRFSWEELRFEVQFDAPVIFVSPPDNKNGPILGAPIYFLDGTQRSMEETHTADEMDLRKEYHSRSVKERIHTADNERASWLSLLYAVQRMEAKSLEWQQKRYEQLEAPSLQDSHTLTVALQRKRRSWDTMPSSVSKPYATTTMCHLIEMMAALGVYWKEFDRRRDRYRGEGNGFMVLGERISDLGLMFAFQVYGECRFEYNRVIPVDYIKELCFGYVPTIYRETFDQRRLGAPSDEVENLGSLQMASRREVAETLVVIGCNKNTVQYYLEEDSTTTHLFPFSFEILGMLSQTFHIKNSYFTYIPNPTSDCWDERSLSLVGVLGSLQGLFGCPPPGGYPQRIYIWPHRCPHRNDTEPPKQRRRRFAAAAPCGASQRSGRCRRGLDGQGQGSCPPTDPPRSHKSSLSRGNKRPTPAQLDGAETQKQRRRREIVQDVLRHAVAARPGHGSPSPGNSRYLSMVGPSQARFEDINEEAPEFRQHKFMEVYFQVIRGKVIPRAWDSANRRASFTGQDGVRRRASVAGAPPGFGLRKRGTGGTHASVAVQTDPGTVTPSILPPAMAGADINKPRPSPLENEILPDEEAGVESDDHNMNLAVGIDDDTDGEEGDGMPLRKPESLANQPVSHDDVWCTLVFRMICWLMLHDFNKQDVQVSKSELLGSRMPVYIA
ncbi:hypothetical protein ACCO45_004335 [Purpureocillium lilacinum]|uniref:Uncharacterized protein n=1 Tax=Purpureocillium lilacinum TaxID=33203 RepID=A0ACC4E2H7_PURLI